jgi:hypothetical protein
MRGSNERARPATLTKSGTGGREGVLVRRRKQKIAREIIARVENRELHDFVARDE